MEKLNEKIVRLMTMILIAIFVNQIPLLAQRTDWSIIPEGMNMASRVPAGTIPASSMDLTKNQDFTGNVSIPIPLLSLGGVDVQLKYYSKGIANDVKTENQYAPSGVVGIGWQLVYGSISAETNNTNDTTEDKYYFNGPDGSFQLQESSNGTFFIPDYKAWKILRVMDGDAIAGWEITKEDGTIYRYGNYDKTLTSQNKFVVDYSPTNATRFLLGVGGVVINANDSLYSSASFVPYQWDISNIQDVKGNQTTIEYLPVKKSLSLNGHTTTIQYTSESYPYKIKDNKGSVIEFNYGSMADNEFYNIPQTYMQNLFGTKFLSLIKIRGVVGNDTTTYRRIDLNYSSSDICNIGVTKKYLTNVTFKDASGNALPSYVFDYYSSTSDVNPGAMKSITDPKGGKVTYTYSLQQLPNVNLQKTSVVPTMVYYDSLYSSPNDDGLMGKDFLVVRGKNNSLTVYRKQSSGWELDTSFPFSNSFYVKVAGDYVVLYPTNIDTMFVIKRVPGGWQKFNVNNAIIQAGGTIVSVTTPDAPFAGLYVIGTESNYFVVKYNMTGDYSKESIWDVAVINFCNSKLIAQRLTGYNFREDAYEFDNYPNYRLVSMRAFCGENYFVIASAAVIDYNKSPQIGTEFNHFNYSSTNKTWNALPNRFYCYYGTLAHYDLNKNEPHRVYIGKNFIVLALNEVSGGIPQLTRIKVYKKDGTSSATIDSLNIGRSVPDSSGISKIVVADNYYAYTYATLAGFYSPDEIGIRVWNGTTFSSANLNFNQMFNDPNNRQNVDITAMGNRLVVNWGFMQAKIGSIIYSPETNQWSQGVIHHSKRYGNGITKCSSMNNNTLVEMFYTDPAYDYTKLIVTNAYQFQGDSVKVTRMDSLWTLQVRPENWIWQTGSNSFAIVLLGYGRNNPQPDSLRIYTLNNLPNGSMEFIGNPTSVVVNQKTISANTGNDMVHSYSFQNGVMNEFSTPEFRKVVDMLPDNNGKVETSYYTSKDSVVSQINYKYLSGIPYDIRELNNQGYVVQETQKSWTTSSIDPVHAVYFQKLLSESVNTDGVAKTTNYSYDSFPYFQIHSITETNSNGDVRKTSMTYPQNYSSFSGSSDPFVLAIDSMQTKHICNAVIEKTMTNNAGNLVYSGEVTGYKNFSVSQLLPWKKWNLKNPNSDAVSDFTPSSTSQNSFVMDSRYILQQSIDSCDTYGNTLQTTDANGIATTTKWGYNFSRAKSVIKNVKNGEYGFTDLENEWNDWESQTISISSSIAHTGMNSSLSSNSFGPTKNFFVANGIDKNKTYIFEAWVYKTTGIATITIEMRNGAKQGLFSKNAVSSGVNGWEHIIVKISPQEMTTLPSDGYLRVWCGFYGSGNSGYIDDLRFYPSGALMTAMTYDPVTLLVTSKSDENNNPTYVEYDGFERPSNVYGPGKVQLAHNEYSSDLKTTSTNIYRSPNPDGYIQNITDALSRPVMQKTQLESGYITTSKVYDNAGRLKLDYKPSGNATQDDYFSDPLDRLKEQGIYNSSTWANGGGHTLRYSFGANNSSDANNYSASQLNKSTITDENSKVSTEFKDAFGNLIQKVVNVVSTQTDPNKENLKTVFEYNVPGNMSKSTPPNGSSFATTYSYNTLNQLTQKISPDAGTVQYLYDKVGNLRFSKDANQSTAGKFSYNKYDALNRLIETGEYSGSGSFTQTNSDNTSFPTPSDANKIKSQQLIYDSLFIDGQHNLNGKLSKVISFRQGSIACTTLNSYNEFGRLEWLLEQVPNASDKKINYVYDIQGNVTKKCVTDNGSNTFYTFYNYDMAGRLKQVYTNTIDSETGKVKEAEYTYNSAGTVQRLQLGNAQGVDYLYNERDWLTQINQQNLNSTQDPGGDGNNGIPIDKFAEVIGYNNQEHIAGGSGFNWQPQYNGNISWVITKTAGVGLQGVNTDVQDPIIGYVYNYDGANRLTKAEFGYYNNSTAWNSNSMYKLPSISYDRNGNILTMQRNGVNGTAMDNFGFTYQTGKNRLASITNTVSGNQTYNYSYDNNGNVVGDQFRGISNVVYNNRNLPEQLVNSQSTTVNYWYDGNGNRIRKQQNGSDELYVLGADGQTEAVFNADGTVKFFNIIAGKEVIGRYEPVIDSLKLSSLSLNRTYSARHIVAGTQVVVPTDAELKAGTDIRLKPGFTTLDGSTFNALIDNTVLTPQRYYYVKDHLGSIRVTVDQAGEIISYDDYDPWGMQLDGRSDNLADANSKFKFTGKERDTETNYDYLGARYYDSRIGRWLQIDPLVEKYPSLNPYNYTMNNPLRFIDPKGMFSQSFSVDGITVNEDAWNQYSEMQNSVDKKDKNKGKEKQSDSNISSGIPFDYSPVQTLYLKSLGNAIAFGLVQGIDNAANMVSDASSWTTGGLFVLGFFTEGTTWAAIPYTLGIGNAADWTSAGAKTVKALEFGGSWEDAAYQGVYAGVNLMTGVGLKNAGSKFFAKTGLKTALFRNNITGRFISNQLGFTYEAVRDVTNLPIGMGLKQIIDKVRK